MSKKIPLEKVRVLLINLYKYEELRDKFRSDYHKLYDKWVFLYTTRSRFCPMVIFTIENFIETLLDDNKYHEYKRYIEIE